MPNIFHSFNHQTLEAIINCHSRDELVIILGNDYKKIIKKMPYYQQLKKRKATFVDSFLAALEMAEIPVEILWITVGFASLGVATLWVLGGVGFVAAALFMGAFYYYSKKQHEKVTNEKINLEMTEIKIHVLDELLSRYKPKNVALNLPEKKLENVSASYTKSIGLGFSLTLILGMTYWGVSDILFTVGLISATSLLVTPVGLGIALGVALLFGIAFAIQHHYFEQKNNLMKSAKKILHAEYKEREIYLDIFKKIKNSHPIHHDENKLESKNDVLPPKKLQEFKATSQNHRFFKLPMPTLTAPHKINKLIRSQSFG